eukprot:TRINITY_DN1640_c0_g1_i2.p1 TRINITY_DN1640_c0_g1~~TRINITY_DN1640_c0_g1_i2.p1  ORF type:complete len:495 (+),score=92.64 TRINITY_DN1640_c0_g1_i2:202-1485(+)
MRRSLFEERAREVAAQNARPGSSWVAGFNDLTDATPEELRSLLGYNKALRGFSEDIIEGAASRSLAEHGRRRRRRKLGLPKSVDWRRSVPAVVTPVKRQGGCGSCWAFAAAETIESHTAISTGILTSLSPEELNDCTPNPRQCGGSGGCSGAVVQLAYNYTISAGGLAGIWNYPYQSGFGESPACQNGSDGTFRMPRRASITGYRGLPQNDAAALMEAVATKGPIAVSVDATDWWMYQQGIFDSCNHSAPNINHAVVLDGYGTENGTDYWLVRNSWGFEFGEAGYIRLRRYDVEPCGEDPAPLDGFACKVGGPQKVTACGECGVLSDSSYPTGAKTGPMDGFEYRPAPAPEGYGNGGGYGNDDSNPSSNSTDTDDNSSNVSRSSSDVNSTDNLPRRLSLTSQSNAASTLPSKTQEEVPEILSASVHV